MKIILIYVAIIAVAIGLGVVLFKSSNKQPSSENQPGTAIEVLNQTHIPEGSTDHPAYNSNPPTSGWHWPSPATCAAYPATQPDERLVHNLEHGGIWVSYKSSVDQSTKDQINDLVRRFDNVITEPRDINDANIAVAAWGRLLKLDKYDESQIVSFIGAFMNKGPERVSCAH